jgi:hypothetical protein
MVGLWGSARPEIATIWDKPRQPPDKLNIAENGYNLLWPITTVAIDNDRNLLPNNPGY